MTALETTQLAVVGAGPAGLAAVREVTELGIDVTLIDENPSGPAAPPGVRFLPETTAWGIFDGRTLALSGPVVRRLLRAQAIVLATGAHERPFAFPGCTLSGVEPARELAPLPDRRVLLAGNGPHLLEAARRHLEAGGEVVAVVEAALFAKPGALSLLRRDPELREILRGRRELERQGVALIDGHVLARVEDDGQKRAALIAPLGPDGLPVLAETRTLAADAIGVGYGFLPSTELLRQAGGAVAYSETGVWLPVRAASLEALAALFVVGAAAGVHDERIAEVEGRTAAVGAARALGALPEARAVGRLVRLQAEARRLEAPLGMRAKLYRVSLSPIACLTPETTVCSCEDVRASQVAEALDEGARTTRELRSYTRLGMGRCQGRMCGATAEAMLRERLGPGAPAPEPLSVRPPVKPVPLESLALLGL